MKELTENTRSRAATGRAGGASGPRRRRGHNEALFTNTRWDARPPLLPGNPRTHCPLPLPTLALLSVRHPVHSIVKVLNK